MLAVAGAFCKDEGCTRIPLLAPESTVIVYFNKFKQHFSMYIAEVFCFNHSKFLPTSTQINKKEIHIHNREKKFNCIDFKFLNDAICICNCTGAKVFGTNSTKMQLK